MKLESSDFQILYAKAIKAVMEAGRMIQNQVASQHSIKEKSTGSSLATQILTQTDLESQKIILKHIVPTCEKYDLGLLSEELEDDLSRFEKDYFWCIDPLDGTLTFVENRPGYAVSVALVSKGGEACLGVIFDPVTETLYSAIKGLGAFRNQKPWNLDTEFSGPYQRVDQGGAVMNACWVLEKAPACFVKSPKVQEGGGCLWDYAATVCLFQELGAVVTDSYGHPLQLNSPYLFMNRRGILYASHGDIAKDNVQVE